MPKLNNNQYASLAREEDNEGNGNESTGVDNNCEIIDVRHDNKITGLDSDNQSTESGSTGATEKPDELTLIEEAIAESERYIAEATDLLAGTVTETEEARHENLIHPALQVPTVEQTYNLQQRKYLRPECTNIYGFQATIINCALTKLLINRGLKKFEKNVKTR